GVHMIKGDKILGAMFSGYKSLPESEITDSSANNLAFASMLKALVLVLVVGALVLNYLMWPVIDML
ncbi:cytochrome b/b6 domain-containing protein, partial [Shewanella sp. 0m-11]